MENSLGTPMWTQLVLSCISQVKELDTALLCFECLLSSIFILSCISQVEELDTALLRCLSYTSSGCLAPLCAALGGIVAQEALKALTGKFMPLSQWVSPSLSSCLSQWVSPSLSACLSQWVSPSLSSCLSQWVSPS